MMITRSFQSQPQRMIGKDLNAIGQMMGMGWGIILTSLISPIKEDSTRDGGTGRIAGTSMNLYDKPYYGQTYLSHARGFLDTFSENIARSK